MVRDTICIPNHGTKTVLQRGDDGFDAQLGRLYPEAESEALEALIDLKRRLFPLSDDGFWSVFTEGLSSIIGAEMVFVSKRMLVDETNAAIEMPPIGEPGACLMATVLYYTDMTGQKHTARGLKYHAYACPCAYMRHDKVFLIADELNNFITENPNTLPMNAQSYIGVPLFADGKCVAHFGALWSPEAASKKHISWGFLEMLLHAVEDIVLARLLHGSDFLQPSLTAREPPQIIPHEAVTAAQSLRPYAGSLSHELRTPMQGVVGMLDIMYATVEECMDTVQDPATWKIFENLKMNIETVQDSSRRAVEAADNVVHAYDMDMSVPEAPPTLLHAESNGSSTTDRQETRPEIVVAGSNLPLARPKKRRLGEAFSPEGSRNASNASSYKVPRTECENCSGPIPALRSQSSQEQQESAQSAEQGAESFPLTGFMPSSMENTIISVGPTPHPIAPGVRHTSLRDVLRYVIDEGLKMGGRPEFVTAQETDDGEIVEVRSRGSDGSVSSKTIRWSVDANIPETMYIDEKDLGKLISCVFLNAIKFTSDSCAKVMVKAKLSRPSSRGRSIIITIADNGPGISKDFLPRLFTAFSQGNSSLTRPSDGLGLGLMVAKGIARKLGGDLVCTRAETEVPDHGTEFEITVPLNAGDVISRASSPFGSPMPRQARISRPTLPQTPPLSDPGTSPAEVPAPRSNATKAPAAPDSYISPSDLDAPASPKSQIKIEEPPVPLQTPRSIPAPAEKIDEPTNGRNRGQRKSMSVANIDRQLASKYPLTFLVAEDNKINRRLLVSMLHKFGYKCIHEAHDGAEALRQMTVPRAPQEQIDVILMDLWMPLMDGFEATERIMNLSNGKNNAGLDGTNLDSAATESMARRPASQPTVLAVTADVTDGTVERAAKVGMKGLMSKPYKMIDLQRLITEYCACRKPVSSGLEVPNAPPMTIIV